MIFIIIGLIVLGVIAIINCLFKIFADQRAFESRFFILEEQLQYLKKQQSFYDAKIELSHVMLNKIQKANTFLNEAIFDLNNDLFGELYVKNDL